VLAIFPAILALVSVLGLLGQSATQSLIDNLGKVAQGPAKDIFTTAVQNLQKSPGAGGVLFFVGLAGALWSASGYVGAFMRASNAIYDIEEGRPIWKKLPVRLGVTLVLVVLLAISALAVVLTGGLADQVGTLLGIGSSLVTVWDIVKWPVLVLIVSFMFALLLLGVAQREATGLSVDEPWRCRRRDPVAHRHGVPIARVIHHGIDVDELRFGDGDGGYFLFLGRMAPSPSTWPTSAPTTRPTEHWAGSSSSWSGCGSRTSPSCSGPSSTPSWSAAARSRRGIRQGKSRSSSHATRGR
jgi:hypothetical protein